MVVSVVIRSRVSNSLERHLHDAAATGSAGINVREPALLKFSDGARVNGIVAFGKLRIKVRVVYLLMPVLFRQQLLYFASKLVIPP
jgi:hypothetical protein